MVSVHGGGETLHYSLWMMIKLFKPPEDKTGSLSIPSFHCHQVVGFGELGAEGNVLSLKDFPLFFYASANLAILLMFCFPVGL